MSSLPVTTTTSPHPEPQRWPWLATVILAALIGLPLASYYLPREQARWTEARAVEAQLDGKLAVAIELMEQAVAQAPEDRWLQLRLAELYQEAGQADLAVTAADQLLQLSSDPQQASLSGGERFLSRLYICKLYAELQRGNGQTALEFAKLREELSPHPRQTLEGLNSLAYIRAMTNREIDQARWCIDEILKRFQRLPDSQLSQPTNLFFQTLTAGALLSRRFDRQGDFLPLINSAIRQLEELQPALKSLLLAEAYEELRNLSGNRLPDGELALDSRVRLARSQQDYACLLLLRALLNDDLGNQADSLADRRAARELGSDEEAWLAQLASDLDCLQLAETTSNLLDTEACVRLRQAASDAQRQQVLNLLDVAIATDEIVRLGWASDLPNQIQLNQDLRAWQRSVTRGLAVKLRHRREVLEALKLTEQADADAVRIRELGFEQEESLF